MSFTDFSQILAFFTHFCLIIGVDIPLQSVNLHFFDARFEKNVGIVDWSIIVLSYYIVEHACTAL